MRGPAVFRLHPPLPRWANEFRRSAAVTSLFSNRCLREYSSWGDVHDLPPLAAAFHLELDLTVAARRATAGLRDLFHLPIDEYHCLAAFDTAVGDAIVHAERIVAG